MAVAHDTRKRQQNAPDDSRDLLNPLHDSPKRRRAATRSHAAAKRPVLALAAAIRRILKAPVSGPALLVSGPAALALTGVVLGLPAAADQAEGDQLGEVVVSATRRDAHVEDVPHNITVVDAKTLEDNHVHDGALQRSVCARRRFAATRP